MATTLPLFDPPPAHDCVRDGPCRTCGARRPDDFERWMFLEPVSLECFDCNHRTIREMLLGTPKQRMAAIERHNPSTTRRNRR